MTIVAQLAFVYFIAIEAHMLILAALSAVELRRESVRSRYERLEALMRSDLSPPVSIVVPAFNEAAGIVVSIRSMATLTYPRFELVIVNDGSTDDTLRLLIETFGLRRVTTPFRDSLRTAPVKAVYRGSRPVSITVVDKENGGRADALNAGINLARYPYVLLTDADVVLDPEALLRLVRKVLDDRETTVAVAGNIRPLNGSRVVHGRVVDARIPVGLTERTQVLEYLRAFLAARPGWSLLNAIPNVSGAFGLYRRDVVVDAGGLTPGHLGEDLDLTLRVRRLMRSRNSPFRISYAPDAVCWTEVPPSTAILRRQRIRWHRGLMTALKDHGTLILNPRYGAFTLFGWTPYFLFEFLGPIVEAVGWVVLLVGWPTGWVDMEAAVPVAIVAYSIGVLNSLVALFLDEAFGYFNRPADAWRLAGLVLTENLGLRQRTVLWRLRALLGGESTKGWGAMPRKGVTNLSR